MKDLKWWKIMFILAVAFMLILGIVGSIKVSQLKARNLELIELNIYFEEQALQSDFAHTTCTLEMDNLEQVIASKDELIQELRVKEEALELYKETLDYTITYVYYLQMLMDRTQIVYPEYIGEFVLSDEYWEEIRD